MQESIRKILTKFKQHDPFRYFNNKENCYRKQASVRDAACQKEQVEKLIRRIQNLEGVIDSLITDANTVVRYYQDEVREMTTQNELIRQQFTVYKMAVQQQKRQSQLQMRELSKTIQRLNEEINIRSIEYHQLLERYEEYQIDTSEVRLQAEDEFKNIHESMKIETLHFSEKIVRLEEEVEKRRNQIEESRKLNEQLAEENSQLKKINYELGEILEHWQEGLQASKRQKQNMEWTPGRKCSHLDSCEISNSQQSEEDQFTFEEIKMNESQETIFNVPKEVLDISQHYSKCNRTEQFLSKQKIPSLININSNECKTFKSNKNVETSFHRNLGFKEPVSSQFVKIATLESRSVKEKSQPQKPVQEIKQFNMPDPLEENFINPYRAFFVLTVQSQKMNSSFFDRICEYDIGYLYDQLVRQGVPYNQWQESIRNRLRDACSGLKK